MTYNYSRQAKEPKGLSERVARRWIRRASGMSLLDSEIQDVVGSIKERQKFIKPVALSLALIRPLAEMLESKALGKMYAAFNSARELAERDIEELSRIHRALVDEDKRWDRLYDDSQEPGPHDSDLYQKLKVEAGKVAGRLWDMWQDERFPEPSMDDFFGPELKSRIVKQLERALEKIGTPEEFGPTIEDWQNPDDLMEDLRSQVLDKAEE